MSFEDGPRLRDEYPVRRTITTRWADEDVYGHVNNVVYYSYFDTAVNAYLIEATGVDIRDLDAVGVVAETGCVFLRELRFPADVEAGIGVERLGRTSVVYRIGLFQGTTAEPAAIGRFVHVYVAGPDRQKVAVPDVIRTAVGPLVT